MKKFSTLIFGFVLLVLVVGAYVFMSTRISGFVATIMQAKEKAFSTDARDQALRGAGALIAETEASRAELATFVVSDSDSVRVIDAVEEVAKREGVSATIGSVAVLPTQWIYHEPVRITFSARGSLGALTRLASTLETIPEASRIVSVSFEASSGNTWFATFVMDFIKGKTPKS